MPQIAFQFTIDIPAARVFEALTDPRHIAGWWTECTSDQKAGGSARFEFRNCSGALDGYTRVRIEKLVPGELVEWKCVDQDYQGLKDWIGTTIRFRLSPNAQGGTEVDFAHAGWKSKEGSFDRCTDGWRHVLATSLKNYLEKGQGEPYRVHIEKEAAMRTRK